MRKSLIARNLVYGPFQKLLSKSILQTRFHTTNLKTMKKWIKQQVTLKKHQTQYEQPKPNSINIKVIYNTKQLSLWLLKESDQIGDNFTEIL